MQKLKLRKIGNSVGLILPKEALAAHKLEAEDEILLIETAEGFELKAFDADLEDAQAWIEKGAKRYKNTLRVLAR